MYRELLQIIDIQSDDIYYSDSKNTRQQFVISLYGKTEDHDTIICHIYDYYPYFYLKVPDIWSATKCKTFLKQEIISKTKGKYKYFFQEDKSKIVNSQEFYGFHYDKDTNKIKTYNYFKIVFYSHSHLKRCLEAIQEYYHTSFDNCHQRYKDWFEQEKPPSCNSYIYESDVHPLLRFIHETKIKPADWIEYEEISDKIHKSCFKNEDVVTSWKKIYPVDAIDITNDYVIASFDIECDSSHGDFPQACKDTKKLAIEIFDSFHKLKDHKMFKYGKQSKTWLQKMIQYAFFLIDKEPSGSTISRIYSSNGSPTEESIDLCITRMKQTTEIDNNLQTEELMKSTTRDTIIKMINAILIDTLQNDKGDQLIIKGDPIIQIGTVFHRYGELTPYKRHIIVIGPEDNMDQDQICNKDYLQEHNIVVERCKTEKDLLLEWQKIIVKEDPDFITGYNIFGFDFKYITQRVSICLSPNEQRAFYNLGRIDSNSEYASDHWSKKCKPRDQRLSSSALGDNQLSYITMDGRILFDIQKEVQKGYNLESYKLDDVSSYFMRGKIKSITNETLITDSIGHLKNGDYISFIQYDNIGEHYYQNGSKIQIKSISGNELTMEKPIEIDVNAFHKIEWCLKKDDVTPQDIFDYHQETNDKGPQLRSEIAKYCIQDCELCINLLLLLDIIPNNLAMANVSYVPASYIFLRGQGIKITSVVARKCNEQVPPVRMPTLSKTPSLKEYQPLLDKGYSKQQIIYELLLEYDTYKLRKYHNWYDSMISIYKTLSDTSLIINLTEKLKIRFIKNDKKLIWSQMIYNHQPKGDIIYQMLEDDGWPKIHYWDYNTYYDMIVNPPPIEGYEGATVLDPNPADIYLEDPIAVLDFASLYPSSIREKNLSPETQIEDESLLDLLTEGVDYHKVSYTNYEYKEKGKSIIKEVNQEIPTITCYFATQQLMGHEGIIPNVLNDLLTKRKETKQRMKYETNEFKKKLLDGLQLAYKVTANSVYGQLGAKTSTIYKKQIAACTTSIGRDRIDDAARGVKAWAQDNHYLEPEVVYGDTDSIFVKFSRTLPDGTVYEGKEALEKCIQWGKESGIYITDMLVREGKEPQDLEYEKTFYPFILISKKRYVGDKYEDDTIHCKRTSMGIVLKRRDNANIVKHVFGTIIEKIMVERDFEKAKEWLVKTLQEIKEGKFHHSMFVITKSLRGYYKNPQQIAHKVLADKMAERDPGNKPKSNDRIPYVYIQIDDKPKQIGYKQVTVKQRVENGFYKNGNQKFKTITTKVDGDPIYKKQTILQGDRIEHIDFVNKHGKDIDYNFYITNQIMNPVKQVLDLRLLPEETEQLFK